jgi:hypothetical protein
MREIEPTRRFQRDYRREKSGVLGKELDELLQEAVNLLAEDKCLSVTLITRSWASGRSIAIAISGPTSF